MNVQAVFHSVFKIYLLFKEKLFALVFDVEFLDEIEQRTLFQNLVRRQDVLLLAELLQEVWKVVQTFLCLAEAEVKGSCWTYSFVADDRRNWLSFIISSLIQLWSRSEDINLANNITSKHRVHNLCTPGEIDIGDRWVSLLMFYWIKDLTYMLQHLLYSNQFEIVQSRFFIYLDHKTLKVHTLPGQLRQILVDHHAH